MEFISTIQPAQHPEGLKCFIEYSQRDRKHGSRVRKHGNLTLQVPKGLNEYTFYSLELQQENGQTSKQRCDVFKQANKCKSKQKRSTSVSLKSICYPRFRSARASSNSVYVNLHFLKEILHEYRQY